MLACPRCRKTYPEDVSTCPDDGTTLLPGHMLAAIDAPLEPGTMIGEYRVDRKLGAGTFGDVYAGEQPVIGKRVAIKLLHRKFSSDAEVVSRFVAEARAVNRIRHRHIIDIFSFGMLGDSRHYFVMELLDGLTLGELLGREHVLSLDVALPIFRGIASGLDAAHEAGITHRDLKPDNVFLAVEKDGSYFAKLLDFGVAKLAGEDVAHRTATGIAIGTPRYMSPEQCRGKKIDHRADIYSLGALIHEVLTGKPLFDGDGAMDIFFKHTAEPPPPMSQVRPELPPELDAPVLAMLAKKPKERPDSAGAAVKELIDRARAAGQAATLPASSKSVRHVVTPPSDAETAPRLPPDAATVAIRQRTPSAPSAPSTKPSDVTTMETAATSAVSVDLAHLDAPGSEGRGSTEIAPASRVSGTLLSPGPEPEAVQSHPGPTVRSPVAVSTDAPVTHPVSKAEPQTRPRAVPWAVIAVVALVVVAGVGLALKGALSPSSATSAAGSAVENTGAAPPPASAASVTAVSTSASTAAPAASATTAAASSSASAMEAPASGVAAPASTSAAPKGSGSPAPPAPAKATTTAGTAGKGIAKEAPHNDLEPPPEISPQKR